MDLSFLKNPVILAILAAIMTYLYMYWDNKKKREANPKADIEPVSLVTPAIVGVLTLFITYGFFGSSNVVKNVDSVGEVIDQTNQSGGVKLLDSNPLANKRKISERLTDTFDSNTYHLVGKNTIRLPQTDVFIDIAKF
jgi:hypothetical protein